MGTTTQSMATWLLSTAMGVTAAAAFGAPAAAQEAPETPITVIGQRPDGELTNPRATAPLVDLPMTVTVVSEEVFSQQGATDLTTVLENTPGITFNAGENGFATGLGNFSMRGFDTSANIFIDGVRDSGNYSRDAYNIEQVEIVKGPAGDNGRGGAGGYVNIVTKTPNAHASYRANVAYGWDEYDSEARQRVTFDLNQPFSDTVAGRINVLWEEGGVAGRAVAERNTWGVAPSIAFGLGTDNRLVVALQHVEQRNTPDWGVPTALMSGMLRYDPTLVSGVSHDSLRDAFYGLASDYDDVDSSVALARYERTLSPNAEFSSQVRWSGTERAAAYTLPTGYAPATDLVTTQRQTYARDNESLSWLNNVSAHFSTGPFDHRIAFGVEFSSERSSALAFPAVTNPGGATQPLANPDPNRAGAIVTAPTERSKVLLDTIALYVYDTIEIGENWEITGGLRGESYQVDISANQIVSGAPLNVNGYSLEEETLSGRLGLVYKPAENGSIYGAVGVASLPPGSFLSNPDISREGDNAFPGFSAGLNSEGADVQRSINYEIGTKWELFDARLSLNAAIFHTVRENVAITGRTGTLTTDPITLQGYGEQIAEGIEISAIGQITDAWSIYAGALYLETERQHSASLDLYRCRAQPGDYGAANPAACNATHGTNGDELAFSPNVTANIWTTYALPFGITIGGGVRYVGESFVGRPDDAERMIPNDSTNVLPDYWVADAMIEYAITPQAILRLNVDNITDEFYAVSTNWSSQRVLLGPSRSFLLSLALRM